MTALPPVVAQLKVRVVVGDLIFDLDEMDGYRPQGCEAFQELDRDFSSPQAAALALETYYNSLGQPEAPRRRGRRASTTGATR